MKEDKSKKMYNSITDIRDEYIEETASSGKRRRSRRGLWSAAAAAVLVIAVTCAAVFWPGGGEQGPRETVLAKSYEPDYRKAYDGAALDEKYLADIRTFAAQAGNAVLDSSATTAYSPTTLYTALSMVSELADGSSLEALLNALGVEGTEELRENSGNLWRYLCTNPDTKAPGKVTLANSIWLNQNYSFNGESLQNLADHYYVASYTGNMKKDIPQRVSEWVRRQTNDLLDCQIKPDDRTMAVLLSAIYFYDDWAEHFDERATIGGWFSANGDGRVDCNYMERKQEHWAYYRGEGVTASVQYFKNGGKMLFILPDDGKSPADVLGNTALTASLLDWEGLDKKEAQVDWAIPRFTLSDTIDLQDGLTALGLGELFDSRTNPLPGLSDEVPAYIGHAEQGTAISIDEKGCEAASYVEIEALAGGAMPPEELVRMYLSRPFVFAILSENDVPLFLGVVNNPNG